MRPEPRLELLLLEPPRLELPLPPRPSRSDLQSPDLLSVRAMATVQGRTRTL